MCGENRLTTITIDATLTVMKKESTRNEIYNKYQHADKWDINEVLRVLLQKRKINAICVYIIVGAH